MKILITLLFILSIGLSQNYILKKDVVDAGGTKMASASYILRSSIGQPTIGKITNASYNLYSGFWSPLPTTQLEPGWTKRTDISAIVKDGGALTNGPIGKATILYCFPGMKTNYFYRFTDGEVGVWEIMEPLPFGKKYPDTTKPNTKYIGKGASLCFDGEHKIYATRGNGTFQLWSYDINSGHWQFESYLPSTKGAKGGTSIDFDQTSGLLYVLVGGQKLEYNNFFSYNPSAKTWATLLKTRPGPYNKVWKDGSCIRKIDNKIYAVKGGDKYNAFWVYHIDGDTWNEIESCPQNHPMLGKKNKFGDGTAICTDGSVIYLIKGKGKQDFWQYTPSDKGVWTALCTIPRYGINYKKSVPKTGASLAYAGSRVWLIKGNKLNEFWQYVPEPKSNVKEQMLNISQTIQSEPTEIFNFNLDVRPNPISGLTTISYTVPVSGNVIIKLYDVTGRQIETLVDNFYNKGHYSIPLATDKLAKGIYFVKCETDNKIFERKLIVR